MRIQNGYFYCTLSRSRFPTSSPTFNNDSELEKTGRGNDFEAGYTLDYKGGSKQASLASDENAMAQLIAVAVLEFGIILHRHVLCVPCSDNSTRRELTEACF